MLTKNEIVELMIHSAKRTAPTNFTVEAVDKAIADELRALAGSMNEFMKNRYDIYQIFMETADEIVPNRVIDAFGAFAEVKVVPQGQKIVFTQKVGRERAKRFVTRAGLSGVYETFRLDHKDFTLETYAQGGAGTVDFERVMDNAENISEVMGILTDALTESIYFEVQKALAAAVNSSRRPEANLAYHNTFIADEMVRLVNTVRAYGDNAVIYAAPEFVAAMGPDAIVPVSVNGVGAYHPQDIDMIHNQGYINIFRGTPVVRLPQSFIDETNTQTWLNPQLAYIFPTGKEKVVKIGLEGGTQVWDFTNKDRSMEIEMYRKIGVAIMTHHNWAIYVNAGIDNTCPNIKTFPTVLGE